MSVTRIGGGQVITASQTTHTFTCPAAGIPIGDLAVILCETSPGGTPVSATDARGNTWHAAVSDSRPGSISTAILWSVITTALVSGDNITVTTNFGCTGLGWHLVDITTPDASPQDGTGHNYGNQGGGAPSWSMTTGQTGDVCLAILAITDTGGTFNGQSGWTTLGTQTGTSTHSGTDWISNGNTSVTVAPAFSIDRNWSGCSAAFKIVNAGGDALLTQAPAEVVRTNAGAHARLTQAPVEVARSPTSPGAARLTQAPVEVVRSSTNPAGARLTQEPVEVLRSSTNPAGARLTQAPVEVLLPAATVARIGRLPLLGAG